MGCGYVDTAVGLLGPNEVRDSGRGRGFCDHQGSDAVLRQDLDGGFDEQFAQEPWIAAYDHARAAWLSGGHVTGNAGHRMAHVCKSEIFRDDCAPARGAEFYLCSRHAFATKNLSCEAIRFGFSFVILVAFVVNLLKIFTTK